MPRERRIQKKQDVSKFEIDGKSLHNGEVALMVAKYSNIEIAVYNNSNFM